MDTDASSTEEHGATSPGSVLGVVEVDLPSRLDVVTVARMVAAAAASCVGVLEADRLDDLRWVTSDAVTNADEANQRTENPGRVLLRIEVRDKGVALSVSDNGPGLPVVDPLPDLTDPERLMTEGGFGIPLMQMLSSTPVVFSTGPAGTTVELEVFG